MASRRSSLAPKDFSTLIFGDGYLSLPSCTSVYHQLEHDPSEITRILVDEDLLVQFLSDFDLYAARICQFLKQLKIYPTDLSRQKSRRRSTVGDCLPGELVQNFLFPLLGGDFEKFHLEPGFHDLFVSVIDFSLPFHPRSLEVLAKLLLEQRNLKLLEALVSGETSSKAMKEWVTSFGITVFDTSIFEAWTGKLIDLCSRCDSNHRISEQVVLHRKLENLKQRLAKVLVASNFPKAPKNLPDPKAMRKLRDSDKKLGSASQKQGPSFEFLPEVLDLLQFFKIEKPTSDRVLYNVLERLKKEETLTLLQAVLNSFPCRPCYDRLMSCSPVEFYSEESLETPAPESSQDSVFFSGLLGPSLGIWRVLLSSQALKDLERSLFEGNFEHIRSKLAQLASGDWRRKSLCLPAGNQSERKSSQGTLYAAVYGSNGRILWQTDSGFDEESGRTMQLVKVWKIGDLKEISKAIQNVLRIQKAYSQSQIEACKCVVFDKSTGRNIPAECDVGPELSGPEPPIEPMGPDREDQSISNRIFYTLTGTVIDNLIAQNVCAEFPLVPSKEELEIIKNNETSTLILGRSGTGKTTCLVYKLFGRYMTGNVLNMERPRRQILLTRSRVLSDKLELYTKRLIDTQLNRASSKVEEEQDLQDILAREDREVTDTIFSIQDDDFPLVCTFDHFMKLLENTTRFANRQDFSLPRERSNKAQEFIMGGGQNRILRKSHLVDFSVFSAGYWQSFSSELRKKFPAALAFVEIIGVIKGSALASNNFQPLGRDEYRTQGSKISPTFLSHSDRDSVYDMYETYERRRRQLGDVDDTDRVRSVLNAISSNMELKERIEGVLDEIYVDEIQDQRLLEIELLLRLIKNPLSIHFAGDTAQCISKDSAFRFQNVKDLFFEHFCLYSTTRNSPELARPRLVELYKNYRTHQGILSLATRVIKLLYRTFPGMVDRLRDEVGQEEGPRPIIFAGVDWEALSSNTVGGADINADNAQFGAEQVIIVRDLTEKENLKAKIGRVALILTILESKGMEFNDVLLYDFFATSQCISAFRSLTLSNYLDVVKHIALCSELKQFYVAITRARSRLWLFESDEGKISPVLKVLAIEDPESKVKPVSLFEVVHVGDQDLPSKLMELRAATASDPRKWSNMGLEFMQKKDYENALYCYERARNHNGKLSAKAYLAEQKGNDHLANGEEELSREQLREAIKLFHMSGLPLREAACYETLGELEQAANILSLNREYGRAAALFDKINHFERASENYRLAGNYNEGASILRRGNCLEKLVYYLNENSDYLDPSCRSHYSKLCNLLLKRGKIPPELKELTIAALGSDSEKEAFFLEYEMTDQLFAFYARKGKFRDAFSLALRNSDLEKASSLAERHGIDQLPQQEAKDVLCYTYAKRLHLRLSAQPGQIFCERPLPIYHVLKPEVLLIKDLWATLEDSVHSLWTQEVSYGTIKFEQKWMKQFFDIFIVFKAPEFIDSAETLAQLPVESINEVLSMIKKLDSPHGLSPFLFFLGIFPDTKEEGSYVLLDWSPLLSIGPTTRNLDTVSTLRKVNQWGLSHVCCAVDRLDQKAYQLHIKEDPIRCAHFLTRGNCSNNRCLFSHTCQTSFEYSISLENLRRMNSVFCNLLPLYYRYSRDVDLMEAEFASAFRKRQRRWLETLLAKITYASTLENAPAALMDTRRNMVKADTRFFGISGGLESLLFHRLTREWDMMRNFSSMLEQMELAEILGVRDRFKRFLVGEVCRRQYFGDPNSAQFVNAWKALANIERFLGPHSINHNSIESTLGWILQTIGVQELSSFHAVCSLYEKMATFLILLSNPQSLLLPNAWVDMYLSPISWLYTQMPGSQSPQIRFRFRQALIALIHNFCFLMHKVSNERGFEPKLSGRPRRWELLVRRNVDFLVVCIVNAYSWQLPTNIPLAGNYQAARSHVLKAFEYKLSNSPPEFRSCSIDALSKHFVASFDKLHGKDFPVIVTEYESSDSFFGLVLKALGVRSIPLDRIHPLSPSSLQVPDTTTPENSKVDDEQGGYTKQELDAAGKIKWFWRARYPIVKKRREFGKTPAGRSISYIQGLCQKVLDEQSLDPKDRLKRRAVLFSECADTLQDAKAVDRQYRKVKEGVMLRIENAELVSTNLMDALQHLWERQSEIKERARKSVQFLTEKNLQSLSTSEWEHLGNRCAETKVVLEAAQADLVEIILEMETVDTPTNIALM